MIRLTAFFTLLASCASAQDLLQLPQGATLTSDMTAPLDSFEMPIRPYEKTERMTATIEGLVQIRTFRIDAPNQNTLALIQFFRAQFAASGANILLDCDQNICGGFDFRFGFDVASAPAMEVDLTDFRYLAAQKTDPLGKFSVSILVSKTTAAAYFQLVEISPVDAPDIPPARTPAAVVAPSDIAKILAQTGGMPLDGLEFASGKAELVADPKGILAEVAKWMADNPAKGLILVGHTDNEGSLDSNVAIARRRAESVRQALIDVHGVEPSRLSAEGVGFLVPRSTNETPDGRAINRRVEIVVR